MLKHWYMYPDLTLRHSGLNNELNNVHEFGWLYEYCCSVQVFAPHVTETVSPAGF
jgi:hypothetical protein